MSTLFTLLFLISFVSLVVGLMKPSWVKLESRKRVFWIFGSATVILMFIASSFVPVRSEAPVVETGKAENTTQEIVTRISTTTAPVVEAENKVQEIVAKIPTATAPVVEQKTSASTPPSAVPATSHPVFGVQTKTSNCIANQALPDSACTPGAILTTDTSVICVSGYTATVRDVPNSVRLKVFQEYGIDYALHSNYEVDHLISLELGGSNDISNLFPESYSIQYGARVKDALENHLHSQACSGKISMETAQMEIATNWLKYYLEWKGNATPTVAVPATTPTITPTAPAQVQSSTAYYTSSFSSSIYYYPAGCTAWKGLSPSYLKSFDSLQALLAAYPSKILSPQCQ